jgi:hypothetical protein
MLALVAMTVLVGVLIGVIGIGGSSEGGVSSEGGSIARSLPVLSANGLSWDHASREIAERERTERERMRQEAAVQRERISQAGETQRAADWQDFGRVVIIGLVVAGSVWIVTRETGATVRNRSDNRTKVAMYALYMQHQYPNARIETRNNQQLVVDPDSRTIFPLAVLKAEASQAGYEEI